MGLLARRVGRDGTASWRGDETVGVTKPTKPSGDETPGRRSASMASHLMLRPVVTASSLELGLGLGLQAAKGAEQFVRNLEWLCSSIWYVALQT